MVQNIYNFSVEFEGKIYRGQWQDDGSVLSVFSKYGNKHTHSIDTPPIRPGYYHEPPPMARTLLREILQEEKNLGRL